MKLVKSSPADLQIPSTWRFICGPPTSAFVLGADSHQECGIGVVIRIGVTRNRGNEPGVGVGVGVDQTARIPTPERFV